MVWFLVYCITFNNFRFILVYSETFILSIYSFKSSKEMVQHQYVTVSKFLVLFLCASTIALHWFKNGIIHFDDAEFNEQKKLLNLSSVVPKESDLCTSPLQVSTKVKQKEEWSKSLWFVALHNSFTEHNELIKNLTLLPNGRKSFYSSIKGSLWHCIGDTETASCVIGALPTKNLV